MKKLTSAILILVASAMATAAEPDAGTKQSLVLAYNDAAIGSNDRSDIAVSHVSEQSAARVLNRTLDVVSASLSVELDSFDMPELSSAR
ncbi:MULTISPECIES: hypothetical protein [Spongiibacter]|uniref:hypothetical protein n=1 Tax=Spongiibacter TaxID=630749 RepID=UPI000C4090FB|nr:MULTISPECIES: hypothetical protein [Spongiibacter]MAY37548.1 hypothetical protein [Spongiibacter sp.]|tara:strand:+ start:6726 stop:6992 length:267 start_codon:yes stop_codon:yes gene_type:complete